MTLKQNIFGIVGGIVLVTAISTAVVTARLIDMAPELRQASKDAYRIAEQDVPLLVRVKEIKTDVVQVQQWLTGISAARGEDGSNSDFDVTAHYAEKFQSDVAAAASLAEALGMADVAEGVARMSEAFPPYYETGRRMVEAYAADGASAGNKLKGAFDAVAEKITDSTDALVELSSQRVRDELRRLEDETQKASEHGYTLILVLLGLGAATLAIAIVGTGSLYRTVSRAFGALDADVTILTAKDHSSALNLRPDRRDEFGPVARAFATLRESEIEAERLAAEQREQQERDVARARRVEELCRDFDETSSVAVHSVADAASELQASSEAMSATAEEATRQSAAVAAASEQASANVQTVATAAEELSSSISEINRQVSQSSHISADAVRQAEETNARVESLARAADKIGEVVALITDIADQTNLLALNATIEAARAGDAGKGFAVVASEVKNLANQTAKATEEIGAQITGIQTETRAAVAAISGIGKTIADINEIAAAIASAIEQQGAATQEIARNVEQAAVGTQEVSANITGISEAANDTGVAATQIRQASGQLARESESMKAAVNAFLESVRAA